MHQDRPSADRRQRRDNRPERHDSRGARVSEDQFVNPADPAGNHAHLAVSGYANPSAPLQIALSVLMIDLDQL